jgi:hypothetical protein
MENLELTKKTLKQMERLEDKDTALLVACMARYYNTGQISVDEVATYNVPVAVILDDAIERMKLDAEADERSVEQRRQAAAKRWAVRPDADGMRPDAVGCGRYAKDAVSVSVSVSDNKKEKVKKEKFVRPTVEEVKAYCIERGNTVDAEAFVAFYDSKGWKVGAAPMKNWKSAVITWEKRGAKAPAKNKFQNFPGRAGNEKAANDELIKQIIGG